MTPALDLDLAVDLEHAVEAGELGLYYQPEVDLASGAIVGMEALLRWHHPRRGLLPASRFVPVAAAAGLLVGIGDWTLRECAREVAEWQRLPRSDVAPQVWVNVAGLQLSTPGFVESVAELVGEFALPPGALGIEVTEHDLVEAGRRAGTVLEGLRAAGAALAVDDFGTWYSSLATVDDLPIDAIKLDQSFIAAVGTDVDDDSIVASVVRLAHASDVYVVAEGVESWAQGARLCELGCDRAYGYLFGPPERAERARALLARGRGWRRPSPSPTVGRHHPGHSVPPAR